MISLMLHEVRARRKMIFWWAVGLAAFGLMYTGFYPSVEKEFGDLDIGSVDLYKAMGVSSMATFEDYMKSTALNILPLWVGAFGIVLGTGALAGEEGAGTLELLAALPISRVKLYTAKTLALLVASIAVVIAIALIVTGLFLFLESEVDTSVTAMDLFGALLSLWLIAFVFLALGLFLGALLPSRGSAAALTAAILVVTFFANNLAAMVSALERLQPLFPSHYYMRVAEMLTGDVPWRDVTSLLVMGIVPLVLGALAFQRRDLTVGAWPWQSLRSGPAASAAAAPGTTSPAPGATAAVPGTTAAASSGRAWRSRRVALPLIVAALFLCCGVVTVAAVALSASDDLRANVEDLLDIGDVVKASGELKALDSVADGDKVTATATGRVVSVPLDVGDVVHRGEVLAVLVDDTGSAYVHDAQGVLEAAWAVLDEIASGETDASADELEAARLSAKDDALEAEKALREARATGAPRAEIDALETSAEFARAGLRIAAVRQALADDSLSDEDVSQVEDAVALAQANLHGAGVEPRPWSVRAPIDGTVTELLVSRGELVVGGRTVAFLSPSDRYALDLHVAEGDAERLSSGQRVAVEIDGYDDPFVGEVAEVAQDDEDADLPFVVRLVVVDPEQLLHEGQEVDVRIPID